MALAPCVVAFVLAATAFYCSAPGVVGGDSPELTAAAFHLGSAHAPGYPLFVLLGHLFQFLPVGTPAFRMTLFSIVVQLLAFYLLVQTLEDLSDSSKSKGAALVVGTWVFAGPLVFHQMVSPEVFALHLLTVSLLLMVLLKPNLPHLYLGAFGAGLGLAHHHLALLLLPALAWSFRGYLKRPKTMGMAAALFVLGFSPYLLLPIRAVQSPLVNWGNPSTFSQFLYHLTRTQYGGDLNAGSVLNGGLDLWLYLKSAFLENFGLGMLLILAGFLKKRGDLRSGYYVGLLFLLGVLPFLLRTPNDSQSNYLARAFLPPALLWLSPLMLKGTEWIFALARKGA
ncbi:MAG TPA: DUF2723 domain-containing protein, partial [bacterium]|nr:DUF2723 domain-containing protein [bacterium]